MHWIIFLLLALGGCSSLPTPAERSANARALAPGWDWSEWADVDDRRLAWAKPGGADKPGPQVLVIEGDGFAFVTASRPSLNPTPLNPVGLRIATALDEAPGVSAAYVARPCQYVQDPGCRQDDWTDGRYTQSVVDRYQRFLAARFPDTPLVLVGYSGGGLIAAGLAQRDPRVIGLVTVAGNIDVNAWLAHHRLPAMNRAVDPAANAGRLVELPQVHLAGQRDRVVPPSIAESFARRSGIDPDQSVRLVDASHGCCWEQAATAAVAEVLADIKKGRESN